MAILLVGLGAGGDDLIADLYNKLAMKRKVIPVRCCMKFRISSAYCFAGYFGCEGAGRRQH